MTIYAVFDTDGFPLAFFDTDVFDYKLPNDIVEISFEQRQELLDNIGVRRWDGEKVIEYTPPPPPPIIPDEISRRQFFQHLANLEIISRAEALAAIQTGAIPDAMQAIIDALPSEDDRFNAMMLVAGATVFKRNNSLADIVRQAMQWSVEQKDEFWLEAAKL